MASAGNISYKNSPLWQILENILWLEISIHFPEAEFSHRYKPELTACTGSLQGQASYDPNCNLILTFHCKIISKVDSCIWMFPNPQNQVILQTSDHFYSHEELLLNNSFKSKDSQSSHSHIEIRSWRDNYHGPVLQRCMKRGILMCCTGLCMYTISVISHLCRWFWFPKSGNHILETVDIYSLTLVPMGSSCISKDIQKTSSKNQPMKV